MGLLVKMKSVNNQGIETAVPGNNVINKSRTNKNVLVCWLEKVCSPAFELAFKVIQYGS